MKYNFIIYKYKIIKDSNDIIFNLFEIYFI